MSPPILLLIGVFVLAAALGPVVAIRQLDAASNAQQRIAGAYRQLDTLLRRQLSEETALRGYLATGQAYFLEDAGLAADPSFEDDVASLRRQIVAAGIDGGEALAVDIGGAHDEWRRNVEEPLLAHPRIRSALAKQTYGKLLTDRMRADAATLRERLSASDARVAAQLRRRINVTVAVSAGTVSVFALLALALAAMRASAIDRIARNEELVETLQRTLRVASSGVPMTEMGVAYASATRDASVGGDLVDAWPSRDGGGWFVVADVSGKGVGAARQAAFVQYALRALAAERDDPAEVIGAFNRAFVDTFDDPSTFVVVFLARLAADARTLSYASAGHPTAYLRRDGEALWLGPTGAIVGLERDESYRSVALPVVDGDTFVVATDGLHEARDASGETLGEHRIGGLIVAGPLHPQALCDDLAGIVRERGDGVIADDLAILALRVSSTAADDVAPATRLGAAGHE